MCVITKKSVNEFWQTDLDKINSPQLTIFSYNGLGLISYKKELEGITEYFQDIATLSKELNGVLISGCDTDTYGVFRHSAVIADKGKILGVSDMIHTIDESEYVSGGSFKVYETSAGKIGIVIGEDIYFPEVPRVLALCDADLIVVVFKKIINFIPELMIRSGAFSNGVTMLLCTNGYVELANIKGEITYASSQNINEFNVKTEKDYHLISSRRRGIYKE